MPSNKYNKQIRRIRMMQRRKKVYGGSLFTRAYMPEIRELIAAGHTSVVDYGCGRAAHWPPELVEELGIKLTLYDPGFKPMTEEPRGQFDLVICSRVLPMIPEEDIPWVVERLFRMALKTVFLVITGPSRKVFPDGTPTAITVKPITWWRDMVARYHTDSRINVILHFRGDVEQ